MRRNMSSLQLDQAVLTSSSVRIVLGTMFFLIVALFLCPGVGAQVDQENWAPELIVSSFDF